MPTHSVLTDYLGRWEKLENYRLQEESLDLLFHRLCPANTSIHDVLLKVSALNDFYSTNIFDTYSVAKHILAQEVDARLAKADCLLVNDIARVTLKGKRRNFYAFATKYCSHHRADDYPIYDYFVEKMLMYYQRASHFGHCQKAMLKQYPRFTEMIRCFRQHYGLGHFTLKQIDVFLWLAGKEFFPKRYT